MQVPPMQRHPHIESPEKCNDTAGVHLFETLPEQGVQCTQLWRTCRPPDALCLWGKYSSAALLSLDGMLSSLWTSCVSLRCWDDTRRVVLTQWWMELSRVTQVLCLSRNLRYLTYFLIIFFKIPHTSTPLHLRGRYFYITTFIWQL